MKSLFVTLASLVVSQVAFAATPNQVVKQYEANTGRVCQYQSSSKMEYCLNYTCQYKQSYLCSTEENDTTLVLKVRSVRYPGEAAETTVLGYELR